MLRTISSDSCRRKGRTPEHMDDLERRRMKIMTRHRQKWEGYGSSLSKRETQAYTGSKFRETGTTFDLRKQDWRVRSSSNFYPGSKIQFKQQNESSQLDAWSLPKNQHNPLSIFKELSSEKVKSQKEKSKSLMKGAKEVNGTRKFLRKGTAINRAIMVTLLRSKINPVVYDSPHSRTTHHDNKLLSAELKHQIPLQLRDAIGCEQMLRMSHIYTGANLKTDDLHVSVNKYIEKAHNMRKSSVIDDDETLKSIKRW